MASTKSDAQSSAAKSPQVTVWLGLELRARVELWAAAERKTVSASIAHLTELGLDAISLSPALLNAIDKRRDEERQYGLTRTQVVESLLRAALGAADDPQRDLFGGQR